MSTVFTPIFTLNIKKILVKVSFILFCLYNQTKLSNRSHGTLLVKQYIVRLTHAINLAMNQAYRRDTENPRNIFVANIVLCKGIPFYGYSVGWSSFLKIYLLSPFYLTKCADLLLRGNVLSTAIQPYESHIPYLLQFFTDFNVTGCGELSLSQVHFRHPVPNDSDFSWVTDNTILDSQRFPRMSFSEIEIDVDASAIMNRNLLTEKNVHHEFNETWIDSVDKWIPTLDGLWKSESRRRHFEGFASFQPPVESTQRVVKETPWRRMRELRRALSKLIKESSNTNLKYETFVNEHVNNKVDDGIPTVFETVSCMFKPLVEIELRSKMLDLNPLVFPQLVEDELISGPDSLSDQKNPDSSEPVDKLNKSTKVSNDESESANKPVNQPVKVVSFFDDFDFDNLSSTTSSDSEKPLDPLSQEVKKEEENVVQDLSDLEDPFDDSITDSMILDESSLQRSILSVVKSDSIIETLTLSQHENNMKRPLSQSSNTKQTSTKLFNDGTGMSSSESNFVTNSQEIVLSAVIKQKKQINAIANAFPPSMGYKLLGPKIPPPRAAEVMNTFEAFGLPQKEPPQPFYSNSTDVPARPVVFAGLEFKLKSNRVQDLPLFNFEYDFSRITQMLLLHPPAIEGRQLRYAPKSRPPSFKEVANWCTRKNSTKQPLQRNIEFSQISGPTPKSKYHFKYATQRQLTFKKTEGLKYLSLMNMEVHVNTRDDFFPNPNEDEITGIFWAFQSAYSDEWNDETALKCGAIFVCDSADEKRKLKTACKFDTEICSSELDLIKTLVDVVKLYDPDILSGYEVSSSSWGYVIERGKKKYEYDLCGMLARIQITNKNIIGENPWALNHTSAITITGRHMFNIWRILRNEVSLTSYSLENVVYHTIHHRLSFYKHKTLTQWFKSVSATECSYTIKYYFDRVFYTIKIINTQELISRTCEQARIVGIDFYSVFYRGSQYKVEAIMSRLTKGENYVMISPSRKQVGEQNALECLPLNMEPETKFYTSPVVVLDFQSLYPSIMIAYNYCYSTCLGRINKWRGKNKLGFTDLELPEGLLKLLETDINIAPNGMIYVQSSRRKSILAKMLAEILDTRVMIKNGMKHNKDDASFQKLMNNRQLALKMIANVTYGYTSASYSGRMPCVEIADSIVQSARETLEAAIELIKTTKEWGADVVYGDTDSLFIHFPGKTKDQAFDIGQEIAKTVTNINPEPIKLKFEKVYYPCILQTKKRYVGYMYENKSQKTPIFDAKGMETIRRDGTPAQQKIEEKSLRILFETCDLSQVKEYFEQQWMKIMSGKVSIQDFCFAKQVKLGSYKGLGPPGAKVAMQKIEKDEYSGPQYRERVPYVVIAGLPKDKLIDRCVSPEILINNPGINLDSDYYITKNLIPPLERIFKLLGANIRQWYDDMPKVVKFHQPAHQVKGQHGYNLRNYLKDTSCQICRKNHNQQQKNGAEIVLGKDDAIVCTDCMKNPFQVVYTLTQRFRSYEKRVSELNQICRNCAKIMPSMPIECVSEDCPIYYSRKRALVFHENSCHTDLKLIEKINSW